MKNCDQIKPLLIDFVDKTLSNELTEVVKDHLSHCKSCRDEVDGLVVLFSEIDETENEIPAASLSSNFQQMLEEEKAKSGNVVRLNTRRQQLRYSVFGQIAAAVAILLAGILIGMLFGGTGNQNDQVASLKQEVNSMKEMVVLSKLEQPVASERIMAANYMEDVTTPDREVLEALINTMNTDKNAGVRMAAMNALSRFRYMPVVADAFVESLAKQTDPIIQISLINILVDMQETRAVDKMKQIIDDNSTNESVKKLAEKGILTLI